MAAFRAEREGRRPILFSFYC